MSNDKDDMPPGYRVSAKPNPAGVFFADLEGSRTLDEQKQKLAERRMNDPRYRAAHAKWPVGELD